MKKIIMTAGLGLLLSGCAGGELLEVAGNVKRDYVVLNASWYQRGRMTASGERFRPNELSVAHRTYPFGTMLRMTNPVTGVSVVARVNDRGPFVKGRSLDVSRAAAERLGMIRRGCMPLRVEVVSNPLVRTYAPVDLTTTQLDLIEYSTAEG
jgi:rare lipoprotein A (peptidoglycan hydrolase)